MDGKKLHQTFCEFNHKYFWNKLGKVKVAWSNKMTLCAGKTYLRVRGKISNCTIRLSRPLLSQRPQQDTINTLLHEMIHAYFNVTRGINFREAHGPEFRKHMARINSTVPGAKVTIYHGFKNEVNNCRVHIYRCDGPCRFQRPNFGILRRAVKRPPGPTERWWERHNRVCGGKFKKVEGSTTSNLENSVIQQEKNIPPPPKQIIKTVKGIITKNKPLIIPKRNTNCFEKKNRINKRKSIIQSGKAVTITKIPVIQVDDSDKNDVFAFLDDPIVRIKEKYSNQKKSILVNVNEVPSIKNGSKLVDGVINLQYKSKNPQIINIEKYLDFFFSNTKKLNTEKSNTEKSYTEKSNTEKLNTEKSSYNSQNLHTMKNNLVSGNINYNYRTKSNLDINKYLNKYKISIGLEETIITNPNIIINNELNEDDRKSRCLDYDDINDNDDNDANVNTKNHKPYVTENSQHNSARENRNYDKISNDKGNDSGQIIICPSCDNEVLEVEFYDHKLYCLENNFVVNESMNNNQISHNKGINEDKISNDKGIDSSHIIICPTCDNDVLETEFYDHKLYCLENNSVCESMNNNQISHNKGITKDKISQDKGIDFGQIMICPNCDNEVLEAEFHDHLSYCIDSEDEGDDNDNDEDDDDDDVDLRPGLPPGVIGCPACMEHVKEEDIQLHMEVCLEVMTEEL